MHTPFLPKITGLLGAMMVAAVVSSPALAGGFVYDSIHEDSFGNLIIQSPSGYKRVVVGKGYLAAELNAELFGEEQPVVAYEPRYDNRRHYNPRCNRQPVLLHGRSYMYGLPDNVVPVPAGICR